MSDSHSKRNGKEESGTLKTACTTGKAVQYYVTVNLN